MVLKYVLHADKKLSCDSVLLVVSSIKLFTAAVISNLNLVCCYGERGRHQ